MSESFEPIAKSPIEPVPPVTVIDGWQVSARNTQARLILCDESARAKVLLLASDDGLTSSRLGVRFGEARDVGGLLVAGSGPGEWLALAAPGQIAAAMSELRCHVDDAEQVSMLDYTHARALMRISGVESREVLASLCAIDLSDATTANRACFRTLVANLVTDVIRDDTDGAPSFLLHCERSSGRYLWGALLEAGEAFGIDVAGLGSRLPQQPRAEPETPNKDDDR